MKGHAIRSAFLEFFTQKGHTVVPSSSLVPLRDPTLLFTNAGMNQFKEVFLGLEERPYKRAASVQKCVRAGGKHNDLEHVGYTARHHTFFEMLGNFSFGDYFKEAAIHYAWEFVTRVLQIPSERLWVTVYAEDEEAFAIWRDQIGMPEARIVRIGDNKGAPFASDNFWMMGDTGPCGPCTEIFYDHGPEVAGGPPGSPDADGDRFIEIWNLVFMQFNRDEQGVLHPLPKPSVDTGMGLERIAAVLQGVHSNYDTDLFRPLLQAACALTGSSTVQPSHRVLADHARATTFLIADGVLPGNEGRGYVLRRIIRRAVRHGWKLGVRMPFFHQMVEPVVAEMKGAYPELSERQAQIEELVRTEEERFFATLEHGMALLDAAIAELEANGGRVLDGALAFKLHDTFGFPLDLTADVLRERRLSVDEAGFERAMAEQRARARAAAQFRAQLSALSYDGPVTPFYGYEKLELETSVAAIYREGLAVDKAQEGDSVVLILAQTPFYAEAGGQVGDQGLIIAETGIVRVEDTQKIRPEVYGHQGVVERGAIAVGAAVRAQVDGALRAATARHHSATHLLHWALRRVLGAHVEQRGSEVSPERLRFDFAHPRPLTAEEIEAIERLILQVVLADEVVLAEVMPLQVAQKAGAMMLFGEKYGDEVRVLTIGPSKELCGGTHVDRTGQIGLLKIVSEEGIAAGIRRIEAVAGEAALLYLQQLTRNLTRSAELLKVAPAEVPERVAALMHTLKAAEKERARLIEEQARLKAELLIQKAQTQEGIVWLISRVEAASSEQLKALAEALRNRLGNRAAVLLGAVIENRAMLVAAVGQEATSRIRAQDWVQRVAPLMQARGGGRPQLAQAGGGDPARLDEALEKAAQLEAF